MSKISDFYAHREEIKKSSGQIELEDNLLAIEEKLLREELMPAVGKALLSLLREVKTPLTLNINYMPDGTLSFSFTRNSLMMKMPVEDESVEEEKDSEKDSLPTGEITEVEEPKPTEKDQTSEEDDNSEDEKYNGNYAIAIFRNGDEVKLSFKTLKKFRVQFPDGTVYCETQGRVTLKKTLIKIGLKRICKEATEIQHSGYQLVGKVPCRDENGTFQNNKQDKVNGYYMYKNTDSSDKILDILKLDRKFGIGLKVYSNEGYDLTDVVKFKEIREYGKKKDLIEEPRSDNAAIKELFEEWLFKEMTQSGAKTYLSTLNNSLRSVINKYVDENADSVFSFTTVSEMETCMELLESNEEYMALGTQKRSSFNSPMLKWKLFLEEFEKEKKNLLNSM